MTNQEAIEELKARKEHYEMGDGCEFLVEALEKGIEALENQKTGHWINQHVIYTNATIDFKVCSECRYEFSYDAETGVSDANYCPNCGAKMEGEKIMTDEKMIEILQEIKNKIDTPNRGTCDYFIVDQIEEIVKRELSDIKGE